MRHPLADTYRAGRERLLGLGRRLGDDEAAVTTTACPAWTVQDVYAHLAGIATDIMNGNTEGAATPAWADGHVAARRGRTLGEVLDEWTRAGAEVSGVMDTAGEAFPLELFVDQWTHEWDIRSALGPMAATSPDLAVFDHYLADIAATMADDERGRGLARLVVDVEGRPIVIGSGPEAGRLPLSRFEFARLVMGRRSRSQIDGLLPWPASIADPAGHLAVLVRWTPADHDVIDPVR